jgi:hypothetical protein
VITGFNTDIRYEGVTYHVQTEDKGLDTPLILSLVYVGGAIIASKRTNYDDLLQKGFDEKVLTERLQRQHKLICAAIRSGRVEELKRMGEQGASAKSAEADKNGSATPTGRKASGTKKKKNAPQISKDEDSDATQAENARIFESEDKIVPEDEVLEAAQEGAGSAPQVEISYSYFDEETKTVGQTIAESNHSQDSGIEIITSLIDEISAMSGEGASGAGVTSELPRFTPPVRDEWTIGHRKATEETSVVSSASHAELPQKFETHVAQPDETDELYLNLLDDEGDFRAGQLATIKIHVGRGMFGKSPVFDSSVTVKVLGTTFRPMIFTTTTDERGVAIVRTMLPHFTSGRAAIIIRAVAGDDAVEMRRIIHQA